MKVFIGSSVRQAGGFIGVMVVVGACAAMTLGTGALIWQHWHHPSSSAASYHHHRRPTISPSPTAGPTSQPTVTPSPVTTPHPTVTSTPAPTVQPTMVMSGAKGVCGESMDTWHPPVINGCKTGHEHGDAPPAWVTSSRWMPMFTHPGNTPNENVLKHSSFKGFTLSDDGIQAYVVMHLDTNPSGHASRFHSVQVWAKDKAGAISHWDYWLDFGQGNNAGPNIANQCGDMSIRPIMAFAFASCGSAGFESWYSRAGAPGWGWDTGFNVSPAYYGGTDPGHLSSSDLSLISSWLPTGGMNGTRRIEAAWYAFRDHPTGDFWSTQWGDLVSGPNDAKCGQTRTIGGKDYTTLCLQQHIEPTMTSLQFPGNSIQKEYDLTGVHLPN